MVKEKRKGSLVVNSFDRDGQMSAIGYYKNKGPTNKELIMSEQFRKKTNSVEPTQLTEYEKRTLQKYGSVGTQHIVV
jgi:hypothetical protein